MNLIPDTQIVNVLLDTLSDSLLLLDADDTIIYANHSACVLFKNDHMLGLSTRKYMPDSRFTHALQKAKKSKKPVSIRILSPRTSKSCPDAKSHQVNAWQVDIAPLNDNDFQAARMKIIIRDLTTEYQSDQIRKDFVANASHELRTPLAIISGYIENLLDDSVLNDTFTARRFLHIMERHTERVTRIIEDMLLISRLESHDDSPPLNNEAFVLVACVQDVLERLESIINLRGTQVETVITPVDMRLRGDRFYWTQIFFNLIENALKQNPDRALTIRIHAHIQNNELNISITDNGKGIPAEHIPYIFKRFYRVTQVDSHEIIKGTGLGLSIVKRAVEAHHGEITATSLPGIQTTFAITLPTSLAE